MWGSEFKSWFTRVWKALSTVSGSSQKPAGEMTWIIPISLTVGPERGANVHLRERSQEERWHRGSGDLPVFPRQTINLED